jgi:hypothetical protein
MKSLWDNFRRLFSCALINGVATGNGQLATGDDNGNGQRGETPRLRNAVTVRRCRRFRLPAGMLNICFIRLYPWRITVFV